MKQVRRYIALLLSFVVVLPFAHPAKACGPETLQPIFVFQDSPDPPFQEFTQGNIGVVKPSFGRKTLVIAYRYLGGGSFNSEEQKSLIQALKATPPEGDGDAEVTAWLAARREALKDEGELPDIYRKAEYESYDFFPNCTSNAFEVAADTLKDRVGRYGAEDASVREWLKGQDTVFRNCAEGVHMPAQVGSDSPAWLRKDRDYQTAAAFFYSLKFDEARRRFELIAQDTDSDWQQTADYLVGRTLVRQGSLESNEKTKRELYQRAETHLTNLLGRTSKFRSGAQKLLGLIKYRSRPEERVRELAQIMTQSGNENLRQDLIDYVWLLDKFNQQVREAEEVRQKLLNPSESERSEQTDRTVVERMKNYLAVERGELIQVWMYADRGDDQMDPTNVREFFFKPETTQQEIVQQFETAFGRKLSQSELERLEQTHKSALESRTRYLSPNRRLRVNEYEGCDYKCNELRLELLPSFLRMDELTDWIFTIQSNDPKAYGHSLAKWRETQSEAWFVAALTKATGKLTPSMQRLLANAEKVQPDSPLFPTVAYNRIRLLTELGRNAEARQLLDEVIAPNLQTFPVSAQNQFIEQRMELAQNLAEFLRFAPRKPAAFYEYGSTGTIAELISIENNLRENQGIDVQPSERLNQLLQWDGRQVLDDNVVDVLNWHFPTSQLMSAAQASELPDYLRQRVLLTVWTRAILLKNDTLAQQAAAKVIDSGIDTTGVFLDYVKASTPTEKANAATFALLKLPILSPYVAPGVPDLDTGEDGYYFELAWWCPLDETTYDEESKEVPKRVASPSFLRAEMLAAAEKERNELRAIGDGKKYIGKRVIEWAKQRPRDSRVPEALYIAVMANLSYKYGCGGWEHHDEIREEAASLLKEMYPNSVWALKLREMEQN